MFYNSTLFAKIFNNIKEIENKNYLKKKISS